MSKSISLLILVVAVAAVLAGRTMVYFVDETEQVVVTEFGKPVGAPVTEAGLHFKKPFVQTVNYIEKRVLEWDGPSAKMPTKDKVYVVVDTFGRWRIADPLVYFEQLHDERSAQSRLDDILGSETRNVVAKHNFIEAVRTTKDREVQKDDVALESIAESRIGVLPPIRKGRILLEKEIFEAAAPKVRSYGVELMDVRFKRINYSDAVSQTIYERMTSERLQIAERYRSEGAGEAAKILGQRERELREIESQAYRRVQEIEGEGDAKATEIYAKAYNASPAAVELFSFTRSMEALKASLTTDTTVILTTDNAFLQYLKSPSPALELPEADLGDSLRGLPSLLDVPTGR